MPWGAPVLHIGEHSSTVICRRKKDLSCSEPGAAPVKSHAKDGNPVILVPERLLSILDKANAYSLFQKNNPDALAGVLWFKIEGQGS